MRDRSRSTSPLRAALTTFHPPFNTWLSIQFYEPSKLKKLILFENLCLKTGWWNFRQSE